MEPLICTSRHEYRLTSYWIGLSDAAGNGRFRWDYEDDDVTFTSWGAAQPASDRNRKCVTLSSSRGHMWQSVYCDDRNQFVCEKEIFISSRSVLRSKPKIEDICKDRSTGYVADPTDCSKYILCFRLRVFGFSCPVNEIYNEERGMCEPGSHTDCNMEVESTLPPVTTTSDPAEDEYGEGYEGYDYGGEDEGEYYTDEEEDVNDEDENDEGDYPDYTCQDSDYIKLGKKCYRIFINPVMWSMANQICIGEERAQLATIKSERVQLFLAKKLKGLTTLVYDYWIGLNDQKTPDKYVWSDGETLSDRDYQNWSRKARKRHKEMKKCVEITMLSKGRWVDDICSNENGYICEKDAINPFEINEPVKPIKGKALIIDALRPRNLYCGTNRRPVSPEAVVGGTTADMAQHPWQASLRSLGEHRCGGSLIDRCWVLTAAHCIDPRSTGHTKLPTLVVLGDFDTSSPEGTEKYLPISQMILHPDWSPKPVPTNDIGLVKLGKCVDDLNPICLPGSDFNDFSAGDECKVAGWGTMDSLRLNYPARLQEADLPIVEQEVCKTKYVIKGVSVIQDNMICAGLLEGGVDACQGDSGGPLGCKGVKSGNRAVQWGIVSWGFGCARRDRPGVYTKVASYMDWIRNHTNINF
uniref:macrophage mannose receptor 1-like isoform X1 n=2 Tax=Styela clava TaxID=7725 RepID=UPI00193A0EC3|nr:macrophage mannose receptor 1-like isoform X1 [Styela clava]